ncbi:hypothetical protein YC2023_044927 [Brassica napus]
MFMSLLERIDRNVSYDCWCSAIIEPVFVVSIDGSRTRWKCDRCFWQCAASDFCNEIHLTASRTSNPPNRLLSLEEGRTVTAFSANHRRHP